MLISAYNRTAFSRFTGELIPKGVYMIKAIFFDIDGTLRDFTEKGIRPGTRRAIELAGQLGIRCFIATGRHLLEIREENLLDNLVFDGYVLLNGSLCLDGGGRILYENPIPLSQKQAMLALSRELGFALIFMEKDAMWHAGGAYDITPKGGSKQLGIEKVIERYGYSREEIAAIGDGFNDIPMIRYAGMGIAMGNGNDQVKAAADFVTDPIDRDGLLHAVEYLARLSNPGRP